mgnify:CR=1 FL=1
MKLCKICNKEIIDKKRKVYCSEQCFEESKKILNKEKIKITSEKHKKQKESWIIEKIELGKVKHNNLIPINKVVIENSVCTHLKQLLNEYDMTVKKYIRVTRSDNVKRNYLMVVITPQMIKDLFDKRYELYKQNFRVDCLQTVKTLEKVFNTINDYK